jgi:hypothetical protein
LTGHLHDKCLLLILDNCEHLVQSCAQFAEAILVPQARVRATSREALGIAGEMARSVSSMETPHVSQHVAATQVARFEAVRLFIDRAKGDDKGPLLAGCGPGCRPSTRGRAARKSAMDSTTGGRVCRKCRAIGRVLLAVVRSSPLPTRCRRSPGSKSGRLFPLLSQSVRLRLGSGAVRPWTRSEGRNLRRQAMWSHLRGLAVQCRIYAPLPALRRSRGAWGGSTHERFASKAA